MGYVILGLIISAGYAKTSILRKRAYFLNKKSTTLGDKKDYHFQELCRYCIYLKQIINY